MRRRRSNRGSVLVLMGVGLVAFTGIAVVAIDLGHLSAASGEVQTLADAAAAAAARALMENAAGADEDPEAIADVVLAENAIDGASGGTAQREVQVGTFDFESRKFDPGGGPPNAARVVVSATVLNMVAGIYGDREAELSREAIAAFSGSASAHPSLPLAVGKCHFEKYQKSGRCSDLPSLTQAPNGKDGSGWTSLSSSSAGASTARRYLPADCGGGGETPPRVRVGATINIMNGQANSVLKTVEDCFKAGYRQFTVPIIDIACNKNFNQQKTVVGFATITLKNVQTQGGKKGIELATICSADAAGETPGGPDLGTRSAALVR